jgi:hypothetical protein
VATKERGTVVAVIIYTLLRVALFAVVWVVIELVTPIHGVWAAASAILISGAISIVVLDRPRDRVGAAAGRFFGRINARIDASTRSEDDETDEPPTRESDPQASVQGGEAPSAQGQDESEHESVDKQ